MIKKYTDFDLDILKELSNVGLGNSSRALSGLLKRETKVKITNLSLISKKELLEHIGGDQKIVAIIVNFKGEIEGCATNVLNEDNTKTILDTLNGPQKDKTKWLTDFGKDTIKEFSNILIGAYLSALSKMIKTRMNTSVPELMFDNSKLIFPRIIPKDIELKKYLIFNIHNVLYSEDFEMPIYCDLVINYNENSVSKILEIAKKQFS
jgi:chemotaxis protein CheY-P-specific phosphatase CheC